MPKSPFITEHTAFTARAAAHQAWYEEQVIRLAELLPIPLDEVDQQFKGWFKTTTIQLQDAIDYCLRRAERGDSMPWEESQDRFGPSTLRDAYPLWRKFRDSLKSITG